MATQNNHSDDIRALSNQVGTSVQPVLIEVNIWYREQKVGWAVQVVEVGQGTNMTCNSAINLTEDEMALVQFTAQINTQRLSQRLPRAKSQVKGVKNAPDGDERSSDD